MRFPRCPTLERYWYYMFFVELFMILSWVVGILFIVCMRETWENIWILLWYPAQVSLSVTYYYQGH